MDPIYLDHNATTPIHADVVEAMQRCYRQSSGNAASQHAAGRRSRRILQEALDGIASILGIADVAGQATRLIITSGGTEANNLALLGLAGWPPSRVVSSAIEHPSTLAACDRLREFGGTVDLIPVDGQGVVDVEQLRQRLDDPDGPPALVSVMLGNNETGVLQPVAEVAQICRARGVPVHTDAVQVVGKLPVDFQRLGVDAMTITAHKFHGPCGVGLLAVRESLPVRPQMLGGFQQLGSRPGTEPVALVVGMHRALEIWQGEAQERRRGLQRLRDLFERRLLEGDETLVINGQSDRLPHTSNISFPGLDRQALLMALDMAGICCSTGSACASGSSEPSHVLLAMGLEPARVNSALRFSVGATTTEDDVARAADLILKTIKHLRR
jgi:cysteine desulfurase